MIATKIHSLRHIQQEVVLACRILVDQKLDSGPFGNVSIRIPNTNQFFINPEGIIFEQLTPDDIIQTAVHADIFTEKFHGNLNPHPGVCIHREIYKLRPDIHAIVHTHSENTVGISLLGCEIEPYTQLGAAIFGDQGLYLGFTGPVREASEGKSIAKALGNKAIVIAKNHGLFATGETIQSALWDMIVADMAAKVHLQAQQLGLKKADKLTDDFFQKSKVEVRERQCDFMWKNFSKKLNLKV